MLLLKYIFIFIYISICYSIDSNSSNNNVLQINEDNYYLIFVNNSKTEYNNISNKLFIKRNKLTYVENFMMELDKLISNNLNTYNEPEKLENFTELRNKFEKRNNNDFNLNENSKYFKHISTLDQTSVIFGYLSSYLVKIIKSMPNVLGCELNKEYKSHQHYNKSDIKLETKWSDVSVKNDSDLHLSLLSQGKFDENLVNKYDTSYYYPKSSGKNIDIFVIDTNFDFRTRDFSNVDERIIKCAVNITDGNLNEPKFTKYCFNSFNNNDHGTGVASLAGGLNHGVATKSNIFGIVINKISDVNIIQSLRYILTKCQKNKGVIIMTFGGYYKITEQPSKSITYIENFISKFSASGIITVVSAGNENQKIYDSKKNRIQYPCYYKNVICVGGIDNFGLNNNNDTNNQISTKIMKSKYYRKADNSNYGKEVNIYAPYYVKYDYCNKNNKCSTIKNAGTSFSAPLVAGVVATIMSENQNIAFNYKNILEYLNKISLKNIINGIKEGNNIFINNGKHIVYSLDNTYFGCGINSGNQSCKKNQCCSFNGKCYSYDKNICKTSEGCQINFGTCKLS